MVVLFAELSSSSSVGVCYTAGIVRKLGILQHLGANHSAMVGGGSGIPYERGFSLYCCSLPQLYQVCVASPLVCIQKVVINLLLFHLVYFDGNSIFCT